MDTSDDTLSEEVLIPKSSKNRITSERLADVYLVAVALITLLMVVNV